jgi:hypothetical protein
VYDTGNSGVSGEREYKRKKNDGEGEERRCKMCYEEIQTIEHMWNGCNEMREMERKERGEILNEDRRD